MNTRKGNYFFILPALIALGFIVVFPIFFGLHMSLHSWNWAAGEAGSMGPLNVQNYIKLFHDVHFWNALWHTLYFSIGALIIEFFVGLICALLLNQDIKGKWFFRTAFILPLMVSGIVAALVWKQLLNPSWGMVNYYLSTLGFAAPNWLGNSDLVIPMGMMVDTWWQTGQITLLLLAGLQSLPQAPLEMALVDGASYFQRLRYIILPMLKPVIVIALLFRTLDLVRVFAIFWGITGGGPGRASEVSQLYIYRQGIGKYLKMGYSASLAIMFSVIVGLLILSVIRYARREGNV